MMGLISSGIDRVRVFALASGITNDGQGLKEPLSAEVIWASEHNDKVHQVYVNGEFAGVTSSFNQRRLVVPVRSGTRGIRVEVYAVEVGQRWVDFDSEIDSGNLQGRVGLYWVRGLSLPLGGSGQVYGDGSSGQVDYSESLTDEDILLWPSRWDKCGFGMSRFGEGDFGYDGSGSVGFGRGGFGYGDFGFDADLAGWTSGEMATGEYKFGVRVRDKAGVVCGMSETEAVAVVAGAGGASKLSIESYDKNSNELVLGIE